MKKFIAAGIQMGVRMGDVDGNLERAATLAEKAMKYRPELIILPEMFATGFAYKELNGIAKDCFNDITTFLMNLAQKTGSFIVGGSIPELAGGKLYNTSFVFSPDRKALGYSRKIHPFAITDEAKYFTGGDAISVIPTPVAKLGIAICYDVRFPEIARKLTLEGAEILIVPAQFPVPREHHWHALMQSRAIENQVFVIGVNLPDGKHGKLGGKGIEFFGHSMVVDPYGNILNQLDDKEGILVCEIDLGQIEKVRKAMPALLNRRPEVY
jgi:omega-amidase